MAFVTLNIKKLKENYDYLNKLFKSNDIKWSVVSKVLCGNKLYLTELLKLRMTQICDSRTSNLKTIKEKLKAKKSIASIYKNCR